MAPAVPHVLYMPNDPPRDPWQPCPSLAKTCPLFVAAALAAANARNPLVIPSQVDDLATKRPSGARTFGHPLGSDRATTSTAT
eukprot:3832020-Pyramimonas_sp.AAC.1